MSLLPYRNYIKFEIKLSFQIQVPKHNLKLFQENSNIIGFNDISFSLAYYCSKKELCIVTDSWVDVAILMSIGHQENKKKNKL